MPGERDTPMRAAVSALRSDELLRFLMRQRWFGAKGMSPTHARIAELIALPWDEGSYAIARVIVRDAGAEREYQLPIGVREKGEAPKRNEAVIETADDAGQTFVLFDAVHDPVFRAKLAEALVNGARVDAGQIQWVVDVVKPGWGAPDGDRSSTVGSAEQSNTSIVIAGRAIYKLFRALTPGVHPDVEVTRFLTTAAGFANTPALFAETRIESGDDVITTGMLQEFLPGSKDAWTFALDRGRAYFAAPPGSDTTNDFVADAKRLGTITRALHDALATGTSPAFTPEPLRTEELERWAHRVQQSIRASLALLEAQTETGRIPAQRTAEARALVRRADHYTGLIDEIVDTVGDDLGSRIRTHGDYHLGQLLHTTNDDFMIIDFEGEPARSLEERRQKTSPLRDVAGMLRSFAYAAGTLAAAVERQVDFPTRELRGARWERDVRGAFLTGYVATKPSRPEQPALLPRDDHNNKRLLSLFEIEKVFYELSYELNNRPEWVGIPMRGISKLLVAEVTKGGNDEGRS
jgi:maltose alpha-D-glucosyltransferase/alpha-amylase